MRFDWWTLALQTVNFAVLAWLLQRFLYRPVLRLVDARRGEIDRQYDGVRDSEAKAKAERAALAAERAGIAAERADALKAAAAEGEAAAERRKTEAEAEAAALLEAARKTLAAERAEALAALQTAALDLGAEAAQRLLAAFPAALRADAWLERIAQHLAALPQAEREALLHRSGDGAALTIVTAAALPAEAAARWRSRIGQQLGTSLPIAFATDPALIAGAELHLPGAILRFSGQSALADLRGAVEAHDHAR